MSWRVAKTLAFIVAVSLAVTALAEDITLTATIPAAETVGDCTCTCDGFSVGLRIDEAQP